MLLERIGIRKPRELSYKVVRWGAAEYVVIECPRGHHGCGEKIGNIKIRQTLTCPNPDCGARWSAVLPTVLRFEAVADPPLGL